MALIERMATGAAPAAPGVKPAAVTGGGVIDIVALLKRSLDEAKRVRA